VGNIQLQVSHAHVGSGEHAGAHGRGGATPNRMPRHSVLHSCRRMGTRVMRYFKQVRVEMPFCESDGKSAPALLPFKGSGARPDTCFALRSRHPNPTYSDMRQANNNRVSNTHVMQRAAFSNHRHPAAANHLLRFGGNHLLRFGGNHLVIHHGTPPALSAQSFSTFLLLRLF
jgi:hypothetical protein